MYRHQPKRRYSHKRYYFFIGLGLVGILLFASTLLWPHTAVTPETPKQAKATHHKAVSKPESSLPKVDLQPTVDAWLTSQSGDYGIVVYDAANKAIIASHQADKQYFTASIYKLFVAYLALMDVQAGTQNPNSVVLAGQSLKTCLYKMIHSSDSPCGEKVLNTMGQAAVTKRLQDTFDLKNTNFPGFVTSAQDASTILERLQAKQDLNAENTNFLLDAMKTQIYRTGLPRGMPAATVADKIGFNSPENWHDTAIVTLPNGREYIVCILGGGGVSSKDIASFGQTIYAKLIEN